MERLLQLWGSYTPSFPCSFVCRISFVDCRHLWALAEWRHDDDAFQGCETSLSLSVYVERCSLVQYIGASPINKKAYSQWAEAGNRGWDTDRKREDSGKYWEAKWRHWMRCKRDAGKDAGVMLRNSKEETGPDWRRGDHVEDGTIWTSLTCYELVREWASTMA